MPVWGVPEASAKPPSEGTGVKPFSMKNAVKMPHAMSAGMFGITMFDSDVPTFCSATRGLKPRGASVAVVITSPR